MSTSLRTVLLTSLAMLAFAGNSLLCRMALKETQIDPASFTSIRLIAGAITLWIILSLISRGSKSQLAGQWRSAFALFVYAAGFSFAYIQLSAATGALLLFGAVQATMIGIALFRGEKFNATQILGFSLAIIGLIGLLLPGLSAPPLVASLTMLLAGIAWGLYSLLGKGALNPLAETAGNFIRALPFTLILSLLMLKQSALDQTGLLLAITSGALASGVGYAIWYAALPALRASTAATVQLSVPVITALAGVVLLAEPLSVRLFIASIAILGGIALVILSKSRAT